MPRISWFSIILLWSCLSQFGNAYLVDNFTDLGIYNILGFRRRVYNSDTLTGAGGLHIRLQGSVTEHLSSSPSGTKNLSGKAIKLKYSTNVIADQAIYIRQQYETAIIPKNKIKLDLSLGNDLEITIPISVFERLNPLAVTLFKITGPLTILAIDIVDTDEIVIQSDLNLLPVFPIVTDLSAVLLIDNFQQWSKPPLNNLNVLRQVSETAQVSVGFVDLVYSHDYILEFFTSQESPFDLQYLALRIVYSSSNPINSTLGILYKAQNGYEDMFACEIEFPVGVSKEIAVPVSAIAQNFPQLNVMQGYGVAIRGNMRIHSLEMIIDSDKQAGILSVMQNQLPTQELLAIKKTFFWNAVQLLKRPGTYQMVIDRSKILESAFASMSAYAFRMDLNVFFQACTSSLHKRTRKFQFFRTIKIALYAPKYGLFVRLSDPKRSLRIIPNASISPSQLDIYKFVGQLLGMALLNREMQSINFVPMIYRFLLNKPIQISDLVDINPAIFHALESIHRGSLDQVISQNGSKPGTSYSHVIANALLHASRLVSAQGDALRQGFQNVIPAQILQGLTETELEHIMNDGRLM